MLLLRKQYGFGDGEKNKYLNSFKALARLSK